MSCTGQSAAAHSDRRARTNQPFWRRVTTGEPSRTTFGPITLTAYSARPTIEATSNHTSGCGWKRHGFMSVLEDVEGRQHDHVHERREHDARDEDATEHLVVEAQVHEERGHHCELDDHHRDE